MRLRIVVDLEDFVDFVGSLARTNLRHFRREPALVQEYLRRFATGKCVAGNPRNPKQLGCHCCTGVQYMTDEDIQEKFEGCAPDDVWSCAVSLLRFHEKMGRGPDDALLGDCDDIAPLTGALVKHQFPERRVFLALSMPENSRLAHAYHLQDFRPNSAEIPIFNATIAGEHLPKLWVYDGSVMHGMPRPMDNFYRSGLRSLVELKLESP